MWSMSTAARVRIVEDLGCLELIEAVHSRPHFPRHAHPTYALGVVYWGANRFRYRGAFHTAPAGTLCTVTPDEVHTVEPSGDVGFAYRCLYPPVDLVREAAESIAGRRIGRTIILPPVIEDAEAARELYALFDADIAGSPRLAREAGLLAFLARVVMRHAVERIVPRAPSLRAKAIERAREYLSAHCAENVALAQLAQVSGLPAFSLLRGFARAYGLPPHAWLIQERVRRAQALLREGLAPADVATEVGFTDQSHLNRHFKRVLGITPGSYRRAGVNRRRV